VYGEFNTLPETPMYEIAPNNEVYEGGAVIFTTLENGITESYTVEILNVDRSKGETKNLLIKITDKDLLEKTGGIIQGMSGSPIIQNGRIVGAVTHVLVDTPEKGYGIFAQTMLDKLNEVA
jgi:stage IV sporulation protein B